MMVDGKGRRVPPERVLAFLGRLFDLLSRPFIRYELRGGRCADELTVAVIVANHRSFFDIVAGLVALHRFGHHPRILIERRYVDHGILGVLSRAIGAIPVDRDGEGRAAYHAGVDALRAGIPILVMPEGRLHWDPDDPVSTGPARTGAVRLATQAEVPLVPAALAGTERVLPPGTRIPRANPFRRKVVACWVADDPVPLTGGDARADTEAVMAALRGLLAGAEAVRADPDRA